MGQFNKPLRNVLLVDDNETDNFVNRRIIQIHNFAQEVVIKTSGKEALEYLVANAATPEKLPELILLDLNMPVVNGFVFLFEYRSLPEAVRKNCHIAILSSSDNRRDIDKVYGYEFVLKYLIKPLTGDALDSLLDRMNALVKK
jgi:CheY-like chemotaxis protein